MNYTKQEKCYLAIQSLLDSCELFAGVSKGSKKCSEYEAYFVPETMWYNRVHLLPGAQDTLAECIRSVSAGVKTMEMPNLISYLGCDYKRKEIAPLLEEAGYISPLPVQAAMFKSLEDFEPVEDTIAVERVPAEMVGEWSEMVAEAFGKPTEKPGMLLLADHPECYFLMHRVDGKMVAGMLLYCKNGNAGIHEVGTLEAYRGKGIAKALLLHALSIAKKQGCTCATLQASPMGVPVYESLGFEDVGTVNTWLILPPGVVL